MLMLLKPPFLTALLFLLPCALLAEDRDSGFIDALEAQFRDTTTIPRAITETELRGFELSDPKLRVAYYWVIKASKGGPEIVDNEISGLVEVVKDIRRRGDATTPLWLDIMANNKDTRFEYRIPMIIEMFGTINMKPYVDYFREMVKTRWETINGGAFSVALETFYNHGTKDDVQMVMEIVKKRPFLAPCIASATEAEERKQRSLAKKLMPETTLAPIHALEPKAPEIAASTKPASPLGTQAEQQQKQPASSHIPLIVMAILSTVVLGLFWFFLKKRK